MSPPVVLTRAIAQTGGLEMWRQAWAIYVGWGVVAAVAFGPGGTTMRELVGALDHSWAERAGALVLWGILLAPAARAIAVATPSYLRTAPVSGFWGAVAFGAMHTALNAGWALLWFRASGLATALVAVVFAAALHATLASSRIDVVSVVGTIAIVVAWGEGERSALGGALAFAVLVANERALWRRFAERTAGATRSWVSGRAPIALARAHVAYMWRAERASVGRTALGLVATGSFAGLIARNNDPRSFPEAAWIVLAVSVLPLLLLSRAFVSGAARSERALDTLVRASDASRAVRLAGKLLAVVGLGAMAGGGVAALSFPFVPVLRETAALWGATMVLWGAGCACTIAAVSGVSAGERGRASARPVLFLMFAVPTLLVVCGRSLALGVGLYAASSALGAVFLGRASVEYAPVASRV